MKKSLYQEMLKRVQHDEFWYHDTVRHPELVSGSKENL